MIRAILIGICLDDYEYFPYIEFEMCYHFLVGESLQYGPNVSIASIYIHTGIPTNQHVTDLTKYNTN